MSHRAATSGARGAALATVIVLMLATPAAAQLKAASCDSLASRENAIAADVADSAQELELLRLVLRRPTPIQSAYDLLVRRRVLLIQTPANLEERRRLAAQRVKLGCPGVYKGDVDVQAREIRELREVVKRAQKSNDRAIAQLENQLKLSVGGQVSLNLE
ncbi:hypothetical protein [Alsobacter sp. R-9]